MKLFGSKKALMKARDNAARHLNFILWWRYATPFEQATVDYIIFAPGSRIEVGW
jgi:hypothetical protein